MNRFFAAAGIALLAVTAAPALAEQLDGAAVTCAEYNAMDAAGKTKAMGAVRGFAMESANAEEAGTVAQMTGETDADFMSAMDAACVAAAGTSTVLTALRGSDNL